MGSEYKIWFENICEAFPGVLALDHVTFGIKPGTVHIVMGENGAGKSTLMKIINGTYEPTEGRMFLDGEEVRFRNTIESEEHGIGMIYQELTYIPDFTVEKYLMMGREPEYFKGFINWKEVNRQAVAMMEREDLHYDPKTLMRHLSVSDIQLLEITKAITKANADIIIMDEPTSALSSVEVERLFKNILRLKERGMTIIYISHKMDEIFRIADYITVMRDGKHIHTAPAEEYTQDSLVTMMVGRELTNVYPKEEIELGDVVLEVKNLSSSYSRLKNVSFNAKKGEILGLAGLVGAGRTETVRAIFGLDRFESGEILVEGNPVRVHSTSDSIRNGIAMATEDRRRYGLIGCRSLKENIALPNLDSFSRWQFIRKKKESERVDTISRRLRIKAPNTLVTANTLSGGNQQKVVLSKWLLASPKILILDEPTRGIDVGAKFEIYKLMTEMVKSGITIIMISSELPEFIGMCDRAYVMHNGSITGELGRDQITQKNIMLLATGGRIDDTDK